MKKTFLAFITFLTLGIFQVSDGVAVQTSPEGNGIVLTDSILNEKINRNKSILNLKSRLDKAEKTILQQKKEIEERSTSDVPFWLLGLTVLNTLGVIWFVISKNRRSVSEIEQYNTKNSDDNTITNDDVKKSITEDTATRYNTASKKSSHSVYRNGDNSQNVVITTYGKEKNAAKTQQAKADKKEKRKAKLHKFVNFMIDNGRISTFERTVSDDGSDKLFAIDYEEGANVATYTINPECKALILSDIQTFQNYVAKFNITGNPTDIVVKNEGRLNKVGKQWIVTEKLIVEFK